MLKGTLDDFTLPDIFRLLSQSGKTGRLDVQRSAGQGNVYFRDGNVYFAESTLSKELIGQKLVKANVLTDGQLIKALDEQAESGGRLGEVLRTAGLVTDDQLIAAVRSQIEDAVFDLLRWDAGEFDWAPNESTDAEVSIAVSVENLIMEGARRLDELAIIVRKIPSENAIVAMAPAPPEGAAEINITPSEWRVLVLVNGQRSVLDIAEAVNSDVFAIMRTLYGLAAAGLVHVPGFEAEPDAEPLPELPPEPAATAVTSLDPAPAPAETSSEGFDFTDEATAEPVEETPLTESAGYDPSAYEPEVISSDAGSNEDQFASEILTAAPDAQDEDRADEGNIEATDMPTGDWFDAPGPGDLTAETPSEDAEDGEGADPFVSEVLAPEFSAEQDAAVDVAAESYEAQPQAEDLDDAFQQQQDADAPVGSGYTGGGGGAGLADLFGDVPSGGGESNSGQSVDKRAAVQELSELFRQSEVDSSPTFLVPDLPPRKEEEQQAEEEAEVYEAPVPEDRHRVEDDEEITRGLISRLIDGVKGL